MKVLRGLRYNTLILFILFVVCALFCCLFPVHSAPLYKSNYTFLLGGLLLCSTLLATKIKDKNLFLFDPFLFCSFLFFCIFLIQPMIDILQDKVYYYAFVNPAYGCKWGTVVFVLSYIAFYIGSYFRAQPNTQTSMYQPLSPAAKRSIAFISIILWIVFALLCIIFFIVNGYSLAYILTLGNLGQAQVDEIFARAGFLGKFSVSMIVSLMYYWVCGRSKLIKCMMFLVTLSILILNGGRSILLVFLLAPVVYYFAKRAKNPSIQLIVILLISFFFMAAAVQAERWSLRSGGEVRVETQWNMDTLLHPMRSNFSTYKLYHLLTDAMPRTMNYLWGQETILYTAVMFVPRGLWPSKPDTPMREIYRQIAGDLAVANGEAAPGLAEFYMDFGIFGCILFSFIFGILVAKLKNLYTYSSSDTHGLILYSVLYVFLFQVVIRGYIPSLFYSILCIFLPYFILKILVPVHAPEEPVK